MSSIDAGKLDRRITIQGFTSASQPNGEVVDTWADVATVWAQKTENEGQERFQAQQFAGKMARSFLFRWSDRVKEVSVKHRIIFKSVEHEIVAVREIGYHEGIEVDCVARSEGPVG